MASCSQFLLLLLLLLLPFMASISPGSAASQADAEEAARPSAAGGGLVQSRFVDEGFGRRRRRLGSFRICALCTCCGGPRGLCLPSPCCYAINCHIPNRPFGFCSFTPKTCNCFGCHL